MDDHDVCCDRGCGEPGTHSELYGMVGETPLYRLVCEREECR